MTFLRLLADDLTGALDTAAEFVGLVGPVQTFWHGAIPDLLPDNAALDSGTRERDPRQAAAITGTLTAHLSTGAIAFKKIDSLMRGQTIVELAACVRAGGWRHCILAPAFPYQNRITRAGRQHAKGPDDAWVPVSGDLVAELRALGVPAQSGRLDATLPPGVSVFAAETDADLRQVVASVRCDPDQMLWSGTGGLAHAIAATGIGDRPQADTNIAGAQTDHGPAAIRPLTPLPHPVLGLFGSDQPATAAQLAACAPYWTVLANDGPAGTSSLAHKLATDGIALASFSHPAKTPRAVASNRIAQAMERLAHRLDPPGTVIVAGGETLRCLCVRLGATSLEVQGRIVPGVARSVMRGGRWDGVTVISKSGAFGPPHLLRELLHLPNGPFRTSDTFLTNGTARTAP